MNTKKIKLGIICPSDVAFRRFMPALNKDNSFEFVGIGIEYERQEERAKEFIKHYGGKIFPSYKDIAISPELDALYIPLPPALHYKWAKEALQSKKHVLLEKPSSTCAKHTQDLITIAQKENLALHENYMFVFHKQISEINALIQSGAVGEVRLYRISFGFPLRAKNDFRYNKDLGGGALLDAGGYTLKYARLLLGESARITFSQSNYIDGFEVDMYGSATLVNDYGVTAQVSFGMDNNYKCSLEVWGSKGTLNTNRVLTAPVGFTPEVLIEKNGVIDKIALSEDDTFFNSIQYFKSCIFDEQKREQSYKNIQAQACLVEQFKNYSNK